MSYGKTVAAYSIVLLGISIMSSVAPAGDEAKKELEKLQGSWRCVSWEVFKGDTVGGKAQLSREPALVIKGNKIILRAENLELPFTLDVTKNPKRITRTIRYALGGNKFKLVEYYSIYTFEGDRLKICSFDFGPAKTAVPKAFPERGKPSEEEVFVEIFESIKDEKK